MVIVICYNAHLCWPELADFCNAELEPLGSIKMWRDLNNLKLEENQDGMQTKSSLQYCFNQSYGFDYNLRTKRWMMRLQPTLYRRQRGTRTMHCGLCNECAVFKCLTWAVYCMATQLVSSTMILGNPRPIFKWRNVCAVLSCLQPPRRCPRQCFLFSSISPQMWRYIRTGQCPLRRGCWERYPKL